MSKLWLIFLLCLGLVSFCRADREWELEDTEADSDDDVNREGRGGMELMSESDSQEDESLDENAASDEQDLITNRYRKKMPQANSNKKPNREKKRSNPSPAAKPQDKANNIQNILGEGIPEAPVKMPEEAVTNELKKKSIHDNTPETNRQRCYTCAFIRAKTDSSCIDPQSSNAMLVKCDTPRSNCMTALIRTEPNNMLNAIIRGCARITTESDPDVNYCKSDKCNSIPYNYPELINLKNPMDSSSKSLRSNLAITIFTCIFFLSLNYIFEDV